MKIKTCRICLIMSEKMTYIGNPLKDYIQDIFKSNGYHMDLQDRNYTCFECKALLKKSYNFIQKALRAQRAMYNILETHKSISLPALESLDRFEMGLISNLSYCRVDVDFFIEEKENKLKSTIGADFNNESNVINFFDTSNLKYEFNDAEDGRECCTEANVFSEENLEIDYKNPSTTDMKIEIEIPDFDKKPEKKVKKRNRNKCMVPPETATDNIVLGCRRRKMIYKNSDDSEKGKKKRKSKKLKKPKIEDKDYVPAEMSPESESPYDSCDDFGRNIKKPKESELEYPRKCDHCNYTIEKSNLHFKHYLFCHTSEEYPYHREAKFVCQFCGIGKTTTRLLRMHEQTHGEKNHQCDKCPKKFHNEERLRAHKIRHSDRQLICDYCNKVFKMRADIVLHIRTHTGEKPFKCHICGAGFAHRGNVGIHVRSKHKLMDASITPKKTSKNPSNKS